jgi:hypothetical protein
MRTFALLCSLVTLPTVAGALTVSLDQGVYQVGDLVEITLDNTDGGAIEFPSWPPFAIVRLDGPYEFPPSSPVIVDLPAGETMTEFWDTGQLPDPAGSYQVVVEWWYQDDPQQVMQSTVPYLLEGPVGTEATTWSAIRGLFR